MRKHSGVMLALILLSSGGCSRRDPETTTPVFHVGTPTNRSSTNSWEIGHEPFYTQPGVNGGRPVTVRPIPSQAGMEPDDPLALAVFQAIAADGGIPTRYLEASAHHGVVQLVGTVADAAQKRRAEAIARAVPGVKQVRSELSVAAPLSEAGTVRVDNKRAPGI